MKKSILGVLVALGVGSAAIAYDQAVRCPYDNLEMHWDGRTKMVNGNVYHEYQCPNRHAAWVQQ